MSIQKPTDLEHEIIDFQTKIQRMIDNSIVYYESFLRDEAALKGLIERIGEIPNNQGPFNEHKADS